jgi:tetratricopeptide (TPR) repeat protein
MHAGALMLAPKQDAYYLSYGRALMQQAEADPARRDALFRAAQAAMDRARQLNPLDLTSAANLALLERTRAQFAPDPAERHAGYLRSLEWMRPVIKGAPNDVRMLDEVALTHYLMGDFNQALSTCKTALEFDPEFAPTHSLMGDVQMALKDWQEAIRSYQHALDLDREQVQAWSGIGFAQAQLGNWEHAAAAYEEAVGSFPEDYPARKNLALALSEAGRYQEALHHARQALAQTPVEDRAMLEGLIRELQAALPQGPHPDPARTIPVQAP